MSDGISPGRCDLSHIRLFSPEIQSVCLVPVMAGKCEEVWWIVSAAPREGAEVSLGHDGAQDCINEHISGLIDFVSDPVS